MVPRWYWHSSIRLIFWAINLGLCSSNCRQAWHLNLRSHRNFYCCFAGTIRETLYRNHAHASWVDDQATELLAEFQIARVVADPARVPLAASPSGFASVAYFRLHGSSRLYYSAYSSDFLDKLAVQVADLAKKASVWCIFDNTASGFAVRNALELSAKLQQTQTLPRPARKIAPAYSKTE